MRHENKLDKVQIAKNSSVNRIISTPTMRGYKPDGENHYEGVYYGSSDDNTIDDATLEGLVEDTLLDDSLEQFLDDSEEDPDTSFDILADNEEFLYSEHDQRTYTPALDLALLSSDTTSVAMLSIAEEEENDVEDVENADGVPAIQAGPTNEQRNEATIQAIHPISPPSLYEIPYSYNKNAYAMKDSTEDDERSQSSVPSGSIKQSVNEIDGVLEELQQTPSVTDLALIRSEDEFSSISDANAIDGGTNELVQALLTANQSFHSHYSSDNGIDENENNVQHSRSQRRKCQFSIIATIFVLVAIVIGVLVGVLVAQKQPIATGVESSQTANPSDRVESWPSSSPSALLTGSSVFSLRPTVRPSTIVSQTNVVESTTDAPVSSFNSTGIPSSTASRSPSLRPSRIPSIAVSPTATIETKYPVLPTNSTISGRKPTPSGTDRPSKEEEDGENKEEEGRNEHSFSVNNGQRPSWQDDDFAANEIQGSDDFYATDDTYDYERHHPDAAKHKKRASKTNKAQKEHKRRKHQPEPYASSLQSSTKVTPHRPRIHRGYP